MHSGAYIGALVRNIEQRTDSFALASENLGLKFNLYDRCLCADACTNMYVYTYTSLAMFLWDFIGSF